MRAQIAKSIHMAFPQVRFGFKNNWYHKLNFEFMDLACVPNSLKYTLRDILEVGSNAPFRGYNQWVANCIYEYATKHAIKEIVELGAGGAPITRHLIKQYPDWEVTFKITDVNPDEIHFKNLARLDKRVCAILEPIDFTKKLNDFADSLLILSAAFHHTPEENKKSILADLKSISSHVIIFEPICPNTSSLIMNFGILLTGLVTPLFKLNSKSILRNIWWCWVFPIAPILLFWDGNVSVFRCWNKKKWQTQEPNAEVAEYATCVKVVISSEL